MSFKLSFRPIVLMIIIAIMFLSAPVANAQSPPDSSSWRFALLTNVSKFNFDGSYKLFDGPFAFGIEYDREFVDYGAFLSPSIIKIQNEDAEVDVSIIAHARILGKFGLGLGYDFWRSSQGILKPKKETLFFTIHYDVSGAFW